MNPSHSDAKPSRHRHAIQLLQSGQVERAIALLQEELQESPAATAVRHDLAVAFAAHGKLDNAILELEQVTRERPEFPEVWGNLGKLLVKANRMPEAISTLERQWKLMPNNTENLVQLSLACKASGRMAAALEWIDRAIREQPTNAELRLKRGVLLAQQQKTGEAVASYREALILKPHYPEVLNNLGVLLREQGEKDEAITYLEQAVKLRSTSVKSWINLGIAYAEKNLPGEARRCFGEALKLQPTNAEAQNNLGNLALAHGRIDDAIEWFQKALSAKGDYAEAYSNLGIAFGKKDLLDQAIACFDQALRWKPHLAAVHLNMAVHCLAAGDFERGWSEYEWRLRLLVPARSYSQPTWDGSPLHGRTILIHTEQGIGDTIQFIRYAPLVKQRGGRVLVECPSALLPLLSRCPGIDQLVSKENVPPPFDVHIPLMSLPRLFRTRVETIPQNVPYLRLEDANEAGWKTQLSAIQGFKIGIAWQGSTDHFDDASRSIPLGHFSIIAEIPGVELISLQKGPGEDQLSAITFSVGRLSSKLDSRGTFMDTASLIKHLDLIITADTALAHLAGAMAIPVWIALPKYADWRWLRNREDSPWYPTARLFRQTTAGDWDGVFHCIAGKLRQRIHGETFSAANATPAYKKAMQLIGQQNYGEAIGWFRQAVEQQPDSFDAWHNLGVSQVKKGQFDEAIVALSKAIHLRPSSPEAHSNLGLVLLQKGKHTEAIGYFRKALDHKPNSPEFLNNLGTAQLQCKHIDEAIESYRKAVAANPKMPDTLRNIGFALRLKKEFAQAREAYEMAIQLLPNRGSLHNELGSTYLQEGRLDEAIGSFRQATEREPNLIDAWNNLAVALSDKNLLADAISVMEQALVHVPGHPETQRNLAIIRLMQGDLDRGFREFEWRWQCPRSGKRSFNKPLWDGSELGGKTILLHAEQGLGDTLQFIRFAPLVKAMGGRVIVECQKPLTALLSRCQGIDLLVAKGDPLPEFDVHTPFMSLPWMMGISLNNIPSSIPYLFAEPERVERWQRMFQAWSGMKVGIAWQGNPKYGGDKHRSIPLRCFTPLAEIPGVRLVSLQKSHGTDQLAKQGHFPVLDLDRLTDNPAGGFMDTAAVMKNLDLVITSDTAIPHLAGGLGVPTWLALCTSCDWRWLREGIKAPWYPAMRLFRQKNRGDWTEVFTRIADDLRAMVAQPQSLRGAAVPISPGELLDKITILQIKSERILDSEKRRNVATELSELLTVKAFALVETATLNELTLSLRKINELLWQIEDDIRECEQRQDFGPRFIQLARSVYQQNDHRAAIKRQINNTLGSRLVEEKSYATDSRAALIK